MPAVERYMKPVSGYALQSHVTAAGRCWNGDALVPFAASHLRRVTYNNGKRNHLRRRYRAFMQNGTVRASCVRSNGERRIGKKVYLASRCSRGTHYSL